YPRQNGIGRLTRRIIAPDRRDVVQSTTPPFWFGLVMILVLSGCAVGPNYHAPKTDVSSAFANGDQTNLVSNAVAIEWWRGFNDATLNRLVDLTLATNQDLRIATARVREARALHTAAVADALPVVTGVAGYNKSVSSAASIPFPLTRSQRELDLYNVG